MSRLVPENEPQGAVGDAPGTFRFSRRTLVWTVALVAFFLGSAVASQADQPAAWFLFVFGASLIAQAVFVNTESEGSVLRWFGIGVVSALVASAYAAAMRGQSAFVDLTGTRWQANHLRQVFDSPLGCILGAVGLSIVCGIVVASMRLFIVKRYGLVFLCLIMILTWLLFWNVGVEAYSVSWHR